MKFHSKSFCQLVCTQVTLSGSFIEIESVGFYLQKLSNLEFYFAEFWNFENPKFKKVNWLKMGLFQKLAGSFSIKWEFAKMGISEVSTARIAKNGIPLYRETPVVVNGVHFNLTRLVKIHGKVDRVPPKNLGEMLIPRNKLRSPFFSVLSILKTFVFMQNSIFSQKWVPNIKLSNRSILFFFADFLNFLVSNV